MGLFKKHETLEYDKEKEYPVIRKSICTGERGFGFKNISDNKFRDVALIRSDKELQTVLKSYAITDEVKTEY